MYWLLGSDYMCHTASVGNNKVAANNLFLIPNLQFC